MALIYLTNKHGHYLAVDHDPVAEEITALVYGNFTDEPWTITYQWKGRNESTFTVPAQTENSIGIPPGQRRFVDAPENWKLGYQSELERITY